MRTLMSSLLMAVALACTSSTPALKPSAGSAPPVGEVPDASVAAAPRLVEEDPWLWLEDIEGAKSMAWVKERNAQSRAEFDAAPGFAPLRNRLKAIYDSKDKIPPVRVMGAFLYNFWRDDVHQRGLWRRTSLSEFRKAEPKWETVLDVDALGTAEKQSYVWHGSQCLPPKYERCLVSLSVGGSDASLVREFDLTKKAFVEGGFSVPAAKSRYAWKNQDALYMATDFGLGSLTKAGYPRLLKEWKRGTKLEEARLLLEGEESDMMVAVSHQLDHGKPVDLVLRLPTFFSNEAWLVEGDQLVKLDKPDDADVTIWNEQALVSLRSDWVINENIFKAGSLLVTPLAEFKKGKHDFTALFTPQPNSSLETFAGTRSALILKTLEDVKGVVTVVTRGKKGWDSKRLELPASGNYYADPWDENVNDDFFLWEESFIAPSRLSLGSVGKSKFELLKSSPAHFKADGLEVSQAFAKSKDGTKVPYFLIAKKGLALDGSTPTVLGGYGGFEISLTPEYDATIGASWLERGGAYALANIRGGGEYGPEWHQAAMRHKRQAAYDDFAAVAEDLIARKVTTAAKLGITGASNGGLLVGVMLTQRPELFGAVACGVPLLDMKRYHLLLAGASWMEEYGDPGVEDDWRALKQFSPYQNVKAGVKYPRTFLFTSTRDDRVHPGHARKMTARLLEQQAAVVYFENTEGGHGGSADSTQRAQLEAMQWTFLAQQLGLK